MELNKSIEVVAIEAIGKSRILLALKGTNFNAEQAICLSVLLSQGLAIPEDKLDLIARETTFNSYDFIPEEEKENYMLVFQRYLNDENTKVINGLFDPITKNE